MVDQTTHPPKCHSFVGLDRQIGSSPPALFEKGRRGKKKEGSFTSIQMLHTHTPFFTHTHFCHTPSFTHNIVTHHLSHTTLSHTTCSHTLFQTHTRTHTELCHTLAQKYLIELLMWNASGVHKQSPKV